MSEPAPGAWSWESKQPEVVGEERARRHTHRGGGGARHVGMKDDEKMQAAMGRAMGTDRSKQQKYPKQQQQQPVVSVRGGGGGEREAGAEEKVPLGGSEEAGSIASAAREGYKPGEQLQERSGGTNPVWSEPASGMMTEPKEPDATRMPTMEESLPYVQQPGAQPRKGVVDQPPSHSPIPQQELNKGPVVDEETAPQLRETPKMEVEDMEFGGGAISEEEGEEALREEEPVRTEIQRQMREEPLVNTPPRFHQQQQQPSSAEGRGEGLSEQAQAKLSRAQQLYTQSVRPRLESLQRRAKQIYQQTLGLGQTMRTTSTGSRWAGAGSAGPHSVSSPTEATSPSMSAATFAPDAGSGVPGGMSATAAEEKKAERIQEQKGAWMRQRKRKQPEAEEEEETTELHEHLPEEIAKLPSKARDVLGIGGGRERRHAAPRRPVTVGAGGRLSGQLRRGARQAMKVARWGRDKIVEVWEGEEPRIHAALRPMLRTVHQYGLEIPLIFLGSLLVLWTSFAFISWMAFPPGAAPSHSILHPIPPVTQQPPAAVDIETPHATLESIGAQGMDKYGGGDWVRDQAAAARAPIHTAAEATWMDRARMKYDAANERLEHMIIDGWTNTLGRAVKGMRWAAENAAKVPERIRGAFKSPRPKMDSTRESAMGAQEDMKRSAQDTAASASNSIKQAVSDAEDARIKASEGAAGIAHKLHLDQMAAKVEEGLESAQAGVADTIASVQSRLASMSPSSKTERESAALDDMDAPAHQHTVAGFESVKDLHHGHEHVHTQARQQTQAPTASSNVGGEMDVPPDEPNAPPHEHVIPDEAGAPPHQHTQPSQPATAPLGGNPGSASDSNTGGGGGGILHNVKHSMETLHMKARDRLHHVAESLTPPDAATVKMKVRDRIHHLTPDMPGHGLQRKHEHEKEPDPIGELKQGMAYAADQVMPGMGHVHPQQEQMA